MRCNYAALATPRIIAHDLGLTASGSFINLLPAVAPPVIWIGVVVAQRVSRPVLTLLAIGLVAAVFLAVIHQILWNYAYDGDPPTLGGKLEGRLSPGLESLGIRTFATISSLATGTVISFYVATIGWGISRVVGVAGRQERRDVEEGREARASR